MRGRLLALFLTVVGARFFLLERYGASLPFWDQWDGVGMLLLRPWFGGTFDWHTLFLPHNEHRIVLTRLWTLALTMANGQWDNLVEAAANALFCGLSTVLISRALIAALGRAFEGRVLAAVAVYFILPFGWENTLGGFQSQNYFLILFSLAAVWGLGTQRLGTGGWWTGLLGAVLACLSMASGFLAAATVLGMRGWRGIKERHWRGADDLVTGALCLGLVTVGWLTRTVVLAHQPLQAESPALFLAALGRFLAWPVRDGSPWLGLLALVPLGALAVAFWRRDGKQVRAAELLLGVGAWALLQAAAMAYGRGGQGASPASRYMDLLALVPLFNFLAWQILARRARRTGWRWPVAAATVLWLGWLGTSLWKETALDFHEILPGYRERLYRSERNVHGYAATGDFARFLSGDPQRDLPYPSGRLVADLVDDPVVRPLLPAEVRPALAVQLLPKEWSAFVFKGLPPGVDPPEEQRVWGSYTGVSPGANQGTHRARILEPGPLPYLRFSFLGDLGEPGLDFSLAAGPDGPPRHLRPGRVPRDHWRQDTFSKPGPEIFLTAVDRSSERWFAFSEPVEVGFWSRWTGFLLRRGEKIFLLGGSSFLLLLLPLLPRRNKRPRQSALPRELPPTPAVLAPLRLLSVVIPARDEAGCIAATVEGLHVELTRAKIPHEIIVVDDGSCDETWPILQTLSATLTELRPVQNPGPHGFGRAIIHGLDRMRGDAVIIMMADASDLPTDAVRYWQALAEGYDCAFGSRFAQGGRTVDYPWFKLGVNRLANGFIRVLFRVPLNDTTNAFKAYRREVIEGCRPLISTHFNLTVELPLKAIVRGFTWKVVPITWHNRRTGAAKFRLKEMGSRYLFICLYLWLEKHLSRGDYRRAAGASKTR